MNIESISNEKIQDKKTQSNLTQNEAENGASFSEEYKLLLAQNAINTGFIQGLTDINNVDFAKKQSGLIGEISSIHSSFNYDTLTISKEDALFFSDIVEKTDYIIQENNNGSSFQTNLLKVANSSETSKPTEVSKALMNLIEEAYKTQKPMRIDFDNNVSVILRIGRDGKVNAEFIPGDKAVEEYLRNNIGYLKDRLESQDLDYGDIMYKPYKDNSKKQRNNQNGGKQNE